MPLASPHRIRLRRPIEPPRMEIMPIIDVIFLLLTFFIYAMVLMVRVDVMGFELHEYASGVPAEPAPAATISIDRAGDLFLDRQLVALDALIDALRDRREAEPRLEVYLELEAGEGTVDRAPLLSTLFDRLRDVAPELKFVGEATGAPEQ